MRFFYKKNINHETKLFVWKINKTICWLEKNTAFDEKEYKKIKNEKRKKEWLGVRFLLNYVAKIKTIKYSLSGEPLIKHKKISISHSEGLVGVILSKKKTGLDVQKIKKKTTEIKKKFMNDFETIQKKEYNENTHDTIIWTIKESICKYLDNKKMNFKREILVNEIKKNQNFTLAYAKKNIIKVYFTLKDKYIITYIK
tara:strand:+ start:1627 stop:2220 length:594 start_codon:yes stop_codon:yes gene_type:complete